MKVICISSYDEIKKIVEKLNYETGNEILLRGTSGSLVPSIVEKYSFNSYDNLATKENLLLDEFNSYSHINYKFKKGNEKDWEIRIAAREYGVVS